MHVTRASRATSPIEHEPRCHSKRHNTPELDRSTASNSGQRLPLDLELHYPLLEAVDRPPNLDVLREFTFFSDHACDDTPEKVILATILRRRKPAIPDPGGEQEVTVIRRQASPETENNQPLLPYLAIDGLVNKGLIVISKSLEPFLSEGRARAGVSSSMHAR